MLHGLRHPMIKRAVVQHVHYSSPIINAFIKANNYDYVSPRSLCCNFIITNQAAKSQFSFPNETKNDI